LVARKYALLGGVRDEIQELKDELESMTACFRDVAGAGDDDRQKEQVRVRDCGNTEVNLQLLFAHLGFIQAIYLVSRDNTGPVWILKFSPMFDNQG
jgi:hypothetical protein